MSKELTANSFLVVILIYVRIGHGIEAKVGRVLRAKPGLASESERSKRPTDQSKIGYEVNHNGRAQENVSVNSSSITDAEHR